MIEAFVLDGLILLTEVKILERTHLCYHEVISVVMTNCCRNGKKSRHGIMAYVYCISKLVGNTSYMVDVASYKMFAMVVAGP